MARMSDWFCWSQRRPESSRHKHRNRHAIASGFRRPSFEELEAKHVLATFTVTNLMDGPVTMAGDLPGSLRQAVFDANANGVADDIVFQAGLTGTINLNQGEIDITDELTITGLGSGDTIVNGLLNSRIFDIGTCCADAFPVILDGLHLTLGRTTAMLEHGGAIRSETLGLLTIRNSMITDSTAEGAGGGVKARGDVTLMDSTISGNSGSVGGGIHSYGEVTVTESVISGNDAANSGGGIYARGTVTLMDSTISGNTAMGQFAGGGGIHSETSVTVTNSTIRQNSAGRHGGGIMASGVEVTDSMILDNSGLRGGGVYSSLGSITLTNSTISGNTGGGAFTVTNATVTNTIVSENTGFGIRAEYDVTVTNNSTISGNTGRGIHSDFDSEPSSCMIRVVG